MRAVLQSTAQGTHGCGEQVGFCATGKGCSTPWRVGPAPLTGPAGLLRVQHLKGSRSLLTLSVTLQLLKSLSLTSPSIFKKCDRPGNFHPLSAGFLPNPPVLQGSPWAQHITEQSQAGQSIAGKQDKSFQSFLQESFCAHSGMAGKQHPAGNRLLLLMGQIQSYLSGKEFPSLSETSK